MLNEILEKATVGVLVIGVLCVGASSQTDSLSRRGYPPKELHIGNTVAFGPDFDVDGQGFYQEDVSLITADGHQLINPPLPYAAADIEKMMAQLKQSQK